MEHISFQLDSAISKQVEKSMKEFNYSTKTEFIREALRDKLKEIRKEKALDELGKYFGKAKTLYGSILHYGCNIAP